MDEMEKEALAKAIKDEMYAMRIKPVINKLFAKKGLELVPEVFERLIPYCFSQMQLEKVMSETDMGLTFKLAEILDTQEARDIWAKDPKYIARLKASRYDIRHKEALRLCLKEYFQRWFPSLAPYMKFETADFKDKELIAIFEDEDEQRIADALILIEIDINGKNEFIFIYWEQQSEKEENFAKRIFHAFCGVYFHHRRLVFPIAMFTDPAKWKIPIECELDMELKGYLINSFKYQLIKVKDFKAEDFAKDQPDNPLTWAYLPLTDYPKEQRPEIMAKAMAGINKTSKNERIKATLASLVSQSMKLTPDERKQYDELIQKDNPLKEVKMLESMRDLGREEGLEEGMEKGKDELLSTMLRLKTLSMEQISKATGFACDYLRNLANKMNIQVEPTPAFA